MGARARSVAVPRRPAATPPHAATQRGALWAAQVHEDLEKHKLCAPPAQAA